MANPKKGIAKLFRNGRSQAVRLPREFRFEGDAVRIRAVKEGVLLQPMPHDASKWFAEIDAHFQKPFMKKVRNQPATPRRKIFE